MSRYMVIAVGIVSVMIVVVIAILMGSIIKGVRAGKTEIDIKIAGIFNITIHLTDVSKSRDENSKPNFKQINSPK